MEGSQESQSPTPEPKLVAFPADFPLDLNVYDQVEFEDYSPPPSPRADPNDPRRRDFDSLYPLGWLADDQQEQEQEQEGGPRPTGAGDRPPAPIGRLRRRWQRALQQTNGGGGGGGGWGYVEYVPAWTDPDWDDARYVYMGAGGGGGGGAGEADELARQYAKPGLLQTQRPALLPSDAAAGPAGAAALTDAAKRWGVYPYQRWENLPRDDDDGGGGGGRWAVGPGGWSGVTPRAVAGFPPDVQVPLAYARGGGGGGGGTGAGAGAVRRGVGVGDLDVARRSYERECRAKGQVPSEEGLRQTLERLSVNTADVMQADLAGSLLVLLEAVARVEEREEYQRLLFGGNTSNDVSMLHAMLPSEGGLVDSSGFSMWTGWMSTGRRTSPLTLLCTAR